MWEYRGGWKLLRNGILMEMLLSQGGLYYHHCIPCFTPNPAAVRAIVSPVKLGLMCRVVLEATALQTLNQVRLTDLEKFSAEDGQVTELFPFSS